MTAKYAGMTATERRQTGIQTVVAVYLTPEGVEKTGVTADAVKAEIAKLHNLGRTYRWQLALKRWVLMIDEDPTNLRWAVLQGSVYALHAS